MLLLTAPLNCVRSCRSDLLSCRYLRNITIPAAFVTKSTGDTLKALTAKTGTTQEEVIVVMDWTDALPRADKVEWEFWTNSNDQCGAVCDVQKEFIKVLPDPESVSTQGLIIALGSGILLDDTQASCCCACSKPGCCWLYPQHAEAFQLLIT